VMRLRNSPELRSRLLWMRRHFLEARHVTRLEKKQKKKVSTKHLDSIRVVLSSSSQ
jgi:hypothetical protein